MKKTSKVVDIVIGVPLVHPWYMFCNTKDEWKSIAKDVVYTKERFLPKLMVEVGIVKSISEVRRNKPELMITLDKVDYLEVTWGKSKLFIVVGE